MIKAEPAADYSEELSTRYPSADSVEQEMLELQTQLDLPKSVEHFISDIHGEYEMFRHVLKTGSGYIKRTIEKTFGETLSFEDKRNLALLIYYPELKLPRAMRNTSDPVAWYCATLPKLITVGQALASRYTRRQVENLLPEDYREMITAFLYEDGQNSHTNGRLEDLGSSADAAALVKHFAELIQRLAIGHLYIIGDIYDRGPSAHLIMDELLDYHSVTIQWGNHDIVWMGAAAGSEACIATTIRMCLRYASLETPEVGYGIDLSALASLAAKCYADDPCDLFIPSIREGLQLSSEKVQQIAQMHKAISIIQFKLEGQIIARRPQYGMEERLLLDKIDIERQTVRIEGTEYPLLDCRFPTLNPENPYQLSADEQVVIDQLSAAFTNSKKMQDHARFLFSHGAMYTAHNGNLLFHGCVALEEDGSFMPFRVAGEEYAGKAFVDRLDVLAREGFFTTDDPDKKLYGVDAMWYLWCGAESPLFGKHKMATFERYFVADKIAQKEGRNPYYDLRDDEASARRILEEFGLNPESGHIVNGHVPVRAIKGESPVKANGKLIIIDGGFSKAYQKKTGIAGYTLLFGSTCMQLVAHKPIESIEKAVENAEETDDVTDVLHVKNNLLLVRDTDEGKVIQQRLDALQDLLNSYRNGTVS